MPDIKFIACYLESLGGGIHDPEVFEHNRLIDEWAVRVRWQEHGDHLPVGDLSSVIMVLERIG